MDHSSPSHASQPMGGACMLVQQAFTLLLQTVLSACGAVALFWLLFAGTWRWRNDDYWRRFPPNFGCDDSRLMDGCQAEALLWFAALPAVASLCAVGVMALSSRESAHHSVKRSGGVMRRLSDLHMPPQKFWCWWCGGLTGVDVVVVAVWLAINVSWVWAVMGRYQKLLQVLQELTSAPSWQLEWQLISVMFGSLLFPNFILLFYPVSRGSVLLQATGLSWPEGIRYHRWVGHVTMILVTAHSLGFWVIWLLQGVWWREALSNGARLSNLFGAISFIGGLALWLTSLNAAKRANYSVFYAMHHIGFWVFMLGGIMHYQAQLVYFLPCLLLYAVDGAYRVHQALFDKSAIVLQTSVAQEKGQATICSMTIQTPCFGVANTGFVWLNVRAAHFAEWHPYEYVAVNAADGTPALQLYIKAYDRWSRRIVALVAEHGTAMKIRLEGPYAESMPSPQRHQHDALVIVAGGVGITAALSVMQEIAQEQGGKTDRGLPVLLVWSSRQASELQFLAAPVLGMPSAIGLEVTAHIYFTGAPSALAHTDVVQWTFARDQTVPGGAACPAKTTALCPVVTAGHMATQVLHKVAMHAFVFIAAVSALLLARGLTTVWPTGGVRWSTGAAGSITVALVAFAALLAGLLVLWLSLMVGSVTRSHEPSSKRQGGVQEPLLAGETAAGRQGTTNLSPGVVDAPAAAHLAVSAGGTGVDGAGSEGVVLELFGGQQRLPVRCGRPDLSAIIGGWLAQHRQLPQGSNAQLAPGAGLDVGVYGLGPAALVAATQLLCAELNVSLGVSKRGSRGVHLSFYQKTHQL